MTTMQAHLRKMTAHELKEFKRQITPNATQIFVTALKNKKAPANSLSRETSPHANQTFTESPPSRETGPHPSKSRKKLAQALKKRATYEIEQRIRTPRPDSSREVLAEALKRTKKTPHPNQSFKMLAQALKKTTKASESNRSMKDLANPPRRHTKPKEERPTRTYTERIRELIGTPEWCEECGGEHPACLCMKRFEKLRKPETTPLSTADDDSTNSDTLCDSEKLEDD